MIIVFLTSILAAASNAGSSILQRIATGRPGAGELFSRKFVVSVTSHPLFLLGLGLQTLGAILQAVALSRGPISAVEPLLTTDLVFLLIFLNMRVGLQAGLREWCGVAAIATGLSGLFIIARPRGGTAQYAPMPWIITSVAVVLVIIICMTASRRTANARIRVAILSVATGCTYALNAGFTKLMLHQVQTDGLGILLQSWPVYALVVSGILSIYLMQNTYGAGPLAISQPIVETLGPAASVVIGILIFGETVRHTNLALAGEVFCAAILLSGIIVLGSSRKISPGYSNKRTTNNQ